MIITIKKDDLEEWIQYHTGLKVITKDLDVNVIQDKDTNFLIKNYESR